MKALIYKELKLAMHPVCYVFVALFPLMTLIPDGYYPRAIGFIYILSCYPILFLGANKGQQSNDLLYSTLLPVRKKDIVLARIMTVAFMQFAFMALCSCLVPLAFFLQNSIPPKAEADIPVGLGLNAFVLLLAVAIVGFALADLIFFPIYYKNGKSIVMSTLLTILGFIVYLAVFTIALPFIIDPKNEVCNSIPLWIQFLFLGGALIVYVIIHFFVYKISAKKLEKVDF